MMSDGDSFARETERWDGGSWKKGGRCLVFPLQIVYQPLISTVTPQEKEFILIPSLISLFHRVWAIEDYIYFPCGLVHACLSYESQ